HPTGGYRRGKEKKMPPSVNEGDRPPRTGTTSDHFLSPLGEKQHDCSGSHAIEPQLCRQLGAKSLGQTLIVLNLAQDPTAARSPHCGISVQTGCRLRVNRDRGGRSHTITHVRFAPKATVRSSDRRMSRSASSTTGYSRGRLADPG